VKEHKGKVRTNMNQARLSLFLLFVLACLVLVSPVYAAEDSEVNLSDFPQKLADQLMIPLFAGQILATALVTALFIFVPVLAKSVMGTVVMTIISLTLCIALTWTPYWLLIMAAIIIGLMVATNFRKMLAGGGD